MKSCDLKEPLSANSKSSGSDDVKPLSHRKAKNQKSSSKTSEVSPPEEFTVENGQRAAENSETENKYDNVVIKTEHKYDVTSTNTKDKCDVTDMSCDDTEMKPVLSEDQGSQPLPPKVEEKTTNILEEAVKIIFDEPTTTQDLIVPTGIFSRMTSQAMLAASHPPEYKCVGYEPLQQSVGEYGEKTGSISETRELDVTVKG